MKSFFVDAFTTEPFKGNPAAVCFPEKPIAASAMLRIASEFGFSETAFVNSDPRPGWFQIRYFSPKKEIPLCGHATLAAAKIIFLQFTGDEIYFTNIDSLIIKIRKQLDAFVMEFPIYSTIPFQTNPELLEALGLKSILRSRYSETNRIVLLEIEKDAELVSLQPDFPKLVQSKQGINGVLVTARSSNPLFDFQYRYFWPWAGTNEDPVTGGVQTFLAKYWADKLGRDSMHAFQCSARTGTMQVQLKGDKVWVTGNAVVMLEGNLFM